MTKPFPKKLISFRNLHGGQYGTLDVTARDPQLVELAFGGDYVWLTPAQWAALRQAVDAVFGLDVETVVVATDAEGEPIVIEERERVAVPKRAKRRRAPGGSISP
jgi:hypothetical protein